MIGYLRGKIKFKNEDSVMIDVSGIGFKVFCSGKTIAKTIVGEETELFTYLHRNQTALGIFGFITKEEEEFFEILIDVSGIGPRAALLITSIGPVEKLKKAIMAGDEKFFESIPGIGKKKIQKVILELAGKINKDNIVSGKIRAGRKDDEGDEVSGALLRLGFNKIKIKEALSSLSSEIKNPEEKIREALKVLGGSK